MFICACVRALSTLGGGGGVLDVCVHLSMCEGVVRGGGLDVSVHLSVCEGVVRGGGGDNGCVCSSVRV